jgi:glycosyltransferase involved in cell wall biosynthesis
MKILNICISAPYMEGYSYQENILTDYFLAEGIDTTIIASNILPSYLNSKRIKSGTSNDKGKKIIRIKCFKISSDFQITFGLFNQLLKEKPNVIFHHNLNCTSLVICTLYRILHPNVVLLIDNHVDYINCNKNKLWQLVYYKTLVRASAKFAAYFAKKFYGVTPSRCDFLHEVYGVANTKIDFLPIGADVRTADTITKNKLELKDEFDIPRDSFVFVSGGKMGIDKGTHNLIKAFNQILTYESKVYLVLFGSFNDSETEILAKESKNVLFKGWCDHITSLNLLKLADLAVWPIHHTTLIEDAISVNTPLLIRKTKTTEHLIEGNGQFLDTVDFDELYAKLNSLLNDSFNSFENACMKMKVKLDYSTIVHKIIKDILN